MSVNPGADGSGGSIDTAHACAINRDFQLWCWGSNGRGQLGNGTNSKSTTPVQVAAGTSWTSVSAGDERTCAIDYAKGLWCWGATGLAGDESKTPARVKADTQWESVAAGRSHSCAIDTSGGLWCWGSNQAGQLGDGTTARQSSPVRIGANRIWKSVSLGYISTCAIADHVGSDLPTVSAYCWGSNEFGQVGNGPIGRGSIQLLPKSVQGLPVMSQIAANEYTACAVTSKGQLWCWGGNNRGQLRDGSTVDRVEPAAMPSPASGSTWRSVSVGTGHVCGISTASQLRCWGKSEGRVVG